MMSASRPWWVVWGAAVLGAAVVFAPMGIAGTSRKVRVFVVPGLGPMLRLAKDRPLPACTVFRRSTAVSLTFGGAPSAVCRAWINQERHAGREWSETDPYHGTRQAVCIFYGANGVGMFEVDDHGASAQAWGTCAWFAASNRYVEDVPAEQAKLDHRPLPLTGLTPTSSMEPTLHCSRPTRGCEASIGDLVVSDVVKASALHRGDIVVFTPPKLATVRCGSAGSGTWMKRLSGLPGETVSERNGAIYIDGRLLDEPYIQPSRRDHNPPRSWHVASGHYFLLGDNRAVSCDSRTWASVPAADMIARVRTVLRFRPASEGLAPAARQVRTANLRLVVPKWWWVERKKSGANTTIRASGQWATDTDVVVDTESTPADTLAQNEVTYDRTENPGATDIRLRQLRLAHNTHAWTVTYYIPSAHDPKGGYQEQYFVQRPHQTVWLTFTTGAALVKRYQAWFDRIASSAHPIANPGAA
jgi:signal peptidase I